MTERPIPFIAPMVRAILAGAKTQTRRVATPKRSIEPMTDECPYGQPGDRLWVREAWRAPREFDATKPSDLKAPADGLLGTPIVYEASRHVSAPFGKLRPGMFMPRWASRITLEVTGVRVERLQDISEADAKAEGSPLTSGSYSHRGWYRELWGELNGPASWDANPWVWVIEFRKVA